MLSAPSFILGNIKKTNNHPVLYDNKIHLMLDKNNNYQVFTDGYKTTNCVFKWVLSDYTPLDLTCAVQSLDNQLSFCSPSGESFQFSIFKSNTLSESISLYKDGGLNASYLQMTPQDPGEVKFSIWISIPPHQVVRPGLYSCHLILILFDKNHHKITQDSVILNVNVETSRLIRIATPGSEPSPSGLLDFGESLIDLKKIFSVYVSANTNYRISAKSVNQWRLKMSPEWMKSNYSNVHIPYTLKFKDKLINDPEGRSSVELVLNRENSLSLNKRYDGEITLHPDSSKHWEGVYMDDIIFTVSSED